MAVGSVSGHDHAITRHNGLHAMPLGNSKRRLDSQLPAGRQKLGPFQRQLVLVGNCLNRLAGRRQETVVGLCRARTGEELRPVNFDEVRVRAKM